MVDFPDYLLEHFDPNIIYFGIKNKKMIGVGLNAPRMDLLEKGIVKPAFIDLNVYDEEEEQVQTLIHEVLHYRLDFFERYDDRLETDIEREAQEVYLSRKDIVDLARRTLIDSKNLPHNLG